LLHDRLREQERTGKVNSLELFPGAHVDKPQPGLSIEPGFQVRGRNQERFIFLMAGLNLVNYFLGVEVAISSAEVREGLLWAKRTTAAAADMVLAEERPLGARITIEDLSHG
jgi:hypothetical protein